MTDTSKIPSFRLGPLLAAGLLIFVGLLSVALQLRFANAGADQGDWDAAAAQAVDLARPTDVIAIHPAWSHAPLTALQPLGNLLMPQEEPLIEDLAHHQRILLISERDRLPQALARLPFEASVETAEVIENHGTVQILAISIPPELQLFSDLIGELGDAKVTLGTEDNSHSSPCRWYPSAEAWRCRGAPRLPAIEPTLFEVEHEPRRCIQLFPPGSDDSVALEFNVERPPHLWRLRAGLDERAARLSAGGDLQLRIYNGDELVVDTRLDGHRSKWQAYDLRPASHDENGDEDDDTMTVRLEIQALNETPHHRRFCFNGWPLSEAHLDYESAQSR